MLWMVFPGATITSNALKQAVVNALLQAKG